MTTTENPQVLHGFTQQAPQETPPRGAITAARNARPGLNDYSQELADEICERLADGLTLREISRDFAMPYKRTVMKWMNLNPEFRQRYADARAEGLEVLADEILNVADDSTNDYMDRQLANGKTERVPDHENINRSRLRVDSRKWLLSKLKPAVYGDRVGLDISGQINVNVVNERLAALQAGRLRARTIEVVTEPVAIAGPQQEPGEPVS